VSAPKHAAARSGEIVQSLGPHPWRRTSASYRDRGVCGRTAQRFSAHTHTTHCLGGLIDPKVTDLDLQRTVPLGIPAQGVEQSEIRFRSQDRNVEHPDICSVGKEVGMAGALQAVTEKLFDSLERKDTEGIIGVLADDIQGIDEISRHWMRGIDEFGKYVRQTLNMVEDAHTTITDVHETVQGDSGLLTCWIEQDYTLSGTRQHVSAPTTVVFRKANGAWKVLLFHSLPLPPESA
jgi:ketosteroid isomerase-like protein